LFTIWIYTQNREMAEAAERFESPAQWRNLLFCVLLKRSPYQNWGWLACAKIRKYPLTA
jgi:hypothetical protein